MTPAPNQLARNVARAQWGGVDHQERVCPGVWRFDGPSHGGLVGIVPMLRIDERALAAGRKHDLIETIPGPPSMEVWIGEEDVAWATLVLVCEPVRVALKVTLESVRGEIQGWFEAFLADLEPGYVPQPTGQIRREERRQRILADGGMLLRSAWGDWADGVPAGHVRILCSGANLDEYYTLPEEVYDRRGELPFPHEVTPQDLATLGPIMWEA